MIRGMTDELTLIADRRRQIAAERSQHQEALKALDAEESELTVAERVVRRLSGRIFHAGIVESIGVGDAGDAVVQSGKPADTPTTPEMILTVLGEAMLFGMAGMSPKDLTKNIASRWWPGVTTTEIGPIAWRMAKRGQIEKVGKLYRALVPDANGVVKVTPPEGDEPPADDAE